MFPILTSFFPTKIRIYQEVTPGSVVSALNIDVRIKIMVKATTFVLPLIPYYNLYKVFIFFLKFVAGLLKSNVKH